VVSDSGPGFERGMGRAGNGLGLDNVSRRLQLCYGPATKVVIDSSPGGTTVEFCVPCDALRTAVV
jgi:sensor histidine kinase YesM